MAIETAPRLCTAALPRKALTLADAELKQPAAPFSLKSVKASGPRATAPEQTAGPSPAAQPRQQGLPPAAKAAGGEENLDPVVVKVAKPADERDPVTGLRIGCARRRLLAVAADR